MALGAAEFRDLVAPFGRVVRLVTPAAGRVTFVDFARHGDADRARISLNGRRIGVRRLHVAWARRQVNAASGRASS